MNVEEIRLADMRDVSEIQMIIESVWPNSEVGRERIEDVLGDSTHTTLVYVTEGVVAGFADGFWTISGSGVKRWELDLLAVQPAFQRRGIASALIAANTRIGQLRGTEIARGLVAVDNVGSQGAFARCEYQTDGAIYELLVTNNPHLSTEEIVSDSESDVIPVNTINYSGLWIEGQRSKPHLEKALMHLSNSRYDLAGAVVPTYETDVIHEAKSLGFESVGHYQWWQYPMASG